MPIGELATVHSIPATIPGVALRSEFVVGNGHTGHVRVVRVTGAPATGAVIGALVIPAAHRLLATLTGLAVPVSGWRAGESGATGLIARAISTNLTARPATSGPCVLDFREGSDRRRTKDSYGCSPCLARLQFQSLY